MINSLTITSSRAEYDLLFPLIDSIRKSKKIRNKIVVCGSHLNKEYGNTINYIKKDNFKNFISINTLKNQNKNTNFNMLNSFQIFL